MLGITQQSYARYESEKVPVLPGFEQIHQICSKLNVSADWLLGIDNDHKKSVQYAAESGPEYGECENCKKLQGQVSDLTSSVLSLTRQLEAKTGELGSQKSMRENGLRKASGG